MLCKQFLAKRLNKHAAAPLDIAGTYIFSSLSSGDGNRPGFDAAINLPNADQHERDSGSKIAQEIGLDAISLILRCIDIITVAVSPQNPFLVTTLFLS